MKERGMLPPEADLAEALAQTFDLVSEAQVTVFFEGGYKGGIIIRLAWEGRQDSLHFPWKDVAGMHTLALTNDQRGTIEKYRQRS